MSENSVGYRYDDFYNGRFLYFKSKDDFLKYCSDPNGNANLILYSRPKTIIEHSSSDSPSTPSDTSELKKRIETAEQLLAIVNGSDNIDGSFRKYVKDFFEEYGGNCGGGGEGGDADSSGGVLNILTFDEYRSIYPKQNKYYYVAKDTAQKAKGKFWRIYIKTTPFIECDDDGFTLCSKFAFKFPFKFV